jgi:hypothetical protein
MKKIAFFVMGVLLFSAFASNFMIRSASSQSGLVGYWSFDEGSGTVAYDESGNNNHGTIYGATWVPRLYPWWTYGGNALNFDGVNDYVDVTNESSFDFERTNSFSICAWINPSTMSDTYKAIFSKMTNDWVGYTFYISYSTEGYNPNALGFIMSNTNSFNDLVVYTPDNSISTGWQFVCVTYSGTSNTNGVSFYINGISQQKEVRRDGLTSGVLNNNNPKIGYLEVMAWPNYFNGTIDEVRVYNRVLSDEEIRQLAEAGGVDVVNVESSKTLVGQGYCSNISVTLANTGAYIENISLVTFLSYPSYPTLEQIETFWSMGDVNRDGYIDQIDLDLITKWLWYSDHSLADIDRSHHVDLDDLHICVLNQGKDIYTYFNLSPKPVGRQAVFNLINGTTTTASIIWNTTGYAKGNYTIWVCACPTPYEADQAYHTVVDDVVSVGAPCDVTGREDPPGSGNYPPDGICNMRDIGYFCSKFITNDANCDVTGPTSRVPDGIVNMRDIGEACSNFMKKDP